MSRLRIYAFVSLFLSAVIFTGITVYLDHKSEILSNQIWSEFHQFIKENGTVLGGETHFSDEEEKELSGILKQALNHKEAPILKRYNNWSLLGFLFSTILFSVGFLVLIWGLLKKAFCWIFYTPQRAIITLAISSFVGTCLYPPFSFRGHIYYSLFFYPIWNGSQIFWALLLVEWTVVLLPLGLIYKRLNEKEN